MKYLPGAVVIDVGTNRIDDPSHLIIAVRQSCCVYFHHASVDLLLVSVERIPGFDLFVPFG